LAATGIVIPPFRNDSTKGLISSVDIEIKNAKFMVETDTTSPQPPQEDMQTIRQMARRSKENLMAISFSQRPKTPMRTYVVSGMLMSALGISLGFGVYLMFNPDRSEYEAHGLEGQPSVEHDQALIGGLKKVVPMHNARGGHNPTFGSPRVIEMAKPHPLTTNMPHPFSTNVPPPLINHAPAAPIVPMQAPVQHFAPVNTHHPAGAAGAAEPFHPIATAVAPPIYSAHSAVPVQTYAHADAPAHQIHPMQWPYQQSQGYRAGKDSRLQMVTNR